MEVAWNGPGPEWSVPLQAVNLLGKVAAQRENRSVWQGVQRMVVGARPSTSTTPNLNPQPGMGRHGTGFWGQWKRASVFHTQAQHSNVLCLTGGSEGCQW